MEKCGDEVRGLLNKDLVENCVSLIKFKKKGNHNR